MLAKAILAKAFQTMATARAMADIYDANRQICKYVHSTSKGHEAIQLATAFQLLPCDWVSPYYRDESIMLGIGYTPYELMLQLLAKADDPFSGGRSYYNHPSSKRSDMPKIIHQSSATGMQAIPTTGIAHGLHYMAQIMPDQIPLGAQGEQPVVVCSLGDNSVTEGEVSEAWQTAILHQLPIIYLVQDNDWGISVTAAEARVMDAYDYAAGFPGLHRVRVDGSDFEASYQCMQAAIAYVRTERKPVVVAAKVPLLGHHTSGVRKEFYRTEADLAKHALNDPYPKLWDACIAAGITTEELAAWQAVATATVENAFANAQAAPEPDTAAVLDHVFIPTPVTAEVGERKPDNAEKIIMVDAALKAIDELMATHKNCLLYGQDVGKRLGGVFREAATLGDKYGDARVFNTAIQEAYIVGSTVGMSAVGLKPIVEVQFADYIYPGFNQLVTEISKSCYLSNGKWPVSMVLRVPTGAYGGGGPYHSGSVESTLLTIKGIKVVYPSNAADMKGLMKAAWLDPNPVVMLEHKGLYWSKVPGTEDAKQPEPASDYVLPLGKGLQVVAAQPEQMALGATAVVITYGMGVYWAKAAAAQLNGCIEVIDLRTLYPLDEALIFEAVQRHGKCLVLTEEQQRNSFAEALGYRISKQCFQYLDAPVEVMGALDTPAVPINLISEAAMLPTVPKVVARLQQLLGY